MAKSRIPSPLGVTMGAAERVAGKTRSDAQFADFNRAADRAKGKVPSVDTSDFSFARGRVREPDMSKMPTLKPMASHPQGPQPMRKLPERDLATLAQPLKKKLLSPNRSTSRGRR